VATPVSWKPGDDVIIPPTVSDEQAAAKYPNGRKTLKPYFRIVAQPGMILGHAIRLVDQITVRSVRPASILGQTAPQDCGSMR
jgi:1-Cys peroxiredoxin